MIFRLTTAALIIAGASISVFAQNAPIARAESGINQSTAEAQKVVVVTGNRFSYKLVQKWIDDYNKVNPEVQIIIEARGSNDPLKYDILAEVFEPSPELKKEREYIYVARYAVLPVANSKSAFAKTYGEKGLNTGLIKQVFFHDIFADQEKQKAISSPFTVYTRLQKAGVPIVFANYFGYEQKDIRGTAIAGADSHLLKALQRDSTGITYLPLPLIYDEQSRNPIQGLVVLPVDVNGNGKVSDNEKFFSSVDKVIDQLETLDAGDVNNIPLEYLHLSVDRRHASAEAIDFLKWVNENGQADLHYYGFLKPEPKRFEKEKFNEFASKHGR